jgi:hypothetical protein
VSIITCRPHVPENEQRENFQNATLQGNEDVAVSIATHIHIPEGLDEGAVQNLLIQLLGSISSPDIHFEFEVGPAQKP